MAGGGLAVGVPTVAPPLSLIYTYIYIERGISISICTYISISTSIYIYIDIYRYMAGGRLAVRMPTMAPGTVISLYIFI